jgi:uncharacterized membrane protein
MKIDNRKILIAIVILTILLFPVVLFTEGPLRIILGFPFVIFSPGYTLISALFAKREDLQGLERLALSFGVSIAVVPLLGLALNYTPWGIRLLPVLITISAFIISTSIIALFLQNRLTADKQLYFTLKIDRSCWTSMNAFNKWLTVAIVIAIVIAIVGLAYIIMPAQQNEPYTEFYILGTDGKAENYPRQLLLNQPAEIILVVLNYERQPSSYRIEVKIHDTIYDTIDTGILQDGQKYEGKISITPNEPGDNQKIEFWLYMNESDVAYFDEPLYLYVDVAASETIKSSKKLMEHTNTLRRNKLEVLISP